MHIRRIFSKNTPFFLANLVLVMYKKQKDVDFLSADFYKSP